MLFNGKTKVIEYVFKDKIYRETNVINFHPGDTINVIAYVNQGSLEITMLLKTNND